MTVPQNNVRQLDTQLGLLYRRRPHFSDRTLNSQFQRISGAERSRGYGPCRNTIDKQDGRELIEPYAEDVIEWVDMTDQTLLARQEKVKLLHI